MYISERVNRPQFNYLMSQRQLKVTAVLQSLSPFKRNGPKHNITIREVKTNKLIQDSQ
jgi:hypothetical protein